jgi:hypothetical protein
MKRKLVTLLLVVVIGAAVIWVARSFDWAGMVRMIHGH